MGKLHSKGLPVYEERERIELFIETQEKERNIQGWQLFVHWPELDHQNNKHRKKPLSHISTTRIVGTDTGKFFFHFLDLGMKFCN